MAFLNLFNQDSGYHPHTTETALIRVVNYILLSMDSVLINILMLLDLSSLTQSAMKYLSLAFLLSVSLVQLFPGSLPTVHQPQKVLENKSTALLSLGFLKFQFLVHSSFIE